MSSHTRIPVFVVLTVTALLALSCAGARSGRPEMMAGEATKEMAEMPAAPRAEPAAPSPAAEEDKKGDDGAETAGTDTAARTLVTQAISQIKPPELLARVGTADLQPLPALVQDVTVIIAGHRARVILDMVFRNPSSAVLAGTLMVSLPDRASPCALGMYQGGGLDAIGPSPEEGVLRGLLSPATGTSETLLGQSIELPGRWTAQERAVDWGTLRTAVVVEPVSGRQVYEAVTRARVDPALAEWAGSGSYSARIFPIPAGGLKRVVFAYDQTLVPSGGKILFPLPLPDGKAPVRRLTVHDLSGTATDSQILLNGKPAESSRAAGVGRLWQLQPDPSSGALYVAAPRNPAVLPLTGADPAVPGTLLSVLVTPDLPRQSLMTSTGRGLFLLDTSASGRAGMSALSAQMLRAVLEGDDSLTQFAIVCFDIRATLLTPGFVANTGEARRHYLDLVEQVWLEGATAFETALEYLEGTAELGKADVVFLLSDGEITWGADSPVALARDHADALAKRWVCYAFGTTPHNRRLFDELTRTRGQTVQVGLSQDLVEAARAHRFPVYHLDGVRTTMQDEVIVAGEPGLLYPGQILEIGVRMQRTTTDLRLLLRVDGKDIEVRVPVSRQAATDALASRAWGELFVASLLDEPDQRTERAILALSRHFRLANDYASFLILDTDEDYQRYGVSMAPLDFRQIRQTLSARPAPRSRDRVVLSGLVVPDELPAEAVATIAALSSLGTLDIWEHPPQADVPWAPKFVLEKPAYQPEAPTPTGIYLAARRLMDLAAAELVAVPRGQATAEAAVPKQDKDLHAAQALRVLSTIAETKPRDDQALRLTGFVLMQWGFYDEAEQLFARVRSRRPFEPQNMLLEATAQAAQGKAADAALRYEMVLHQTFPRFQDASRPVAARLYADLLGEAVRRAQPDGPNLQLLRSRLESVRSSWGETTPRLKPGDVPAGRLLLFWNIDDTDVDLHVREGPFSEVWYERMASRTGGRLYWDNTEGLGPELYEHPRLTLGGFRVAVDYFGSSSVEGAAPAATYVIAFTRAGRSTRYRVDWYTTVLVGEQEDRVQIMPIWKR